MTRDHIFRAIRAERKRQLSELSELLAHGDAGGPHQGIRPLCSGLRVSNATKSAVLAEKSGEVCRAVLEGDTTQLQKELVQVAAVAVAWLEAL